MKCALPVTNTTAAIGAESDEDLHVTDKSVTAAMTSMTPTSTNEDPPADPAALPDPPPQSLGDLPTPFMSIEDLCKGLPDLSAIPPGFDIQAHGLGGLFDGFGARPAESWYGYLNDDTGALSAPLTSNGSWSSGLPGTPVRSYAFDGLPDARPLLDAASIQLAFTSASLLNSAALSTPEQESGTISDNASILGDRQTVTEDTSRSGRALSLLADVSTTSARQDDPARSESPKDPARSESPEGPTRSDLPEDPARSESPEDPTRSDLPEDPARSESPDDPSASSVTTVAASLITLDASAPFYVQEAVRKWVPLFSKHKAEQLVGRWLEFEKTMGHPTTGVSYCFSRRCLTM
jgi:hypothetical protein